MTRRMLINARNPTELRVAITSDRTLDDFKVDVSERGLTRGNIYFGIISNVEPSLNAAFIDYGAERNGFLTIQDVVPDAYYKEAKQGARPKIEDVLEQGQPIVVQVTREPEGQKGAALTTNLTLAGRYLVLTPFDSTRGVSRKVDDEETRRKLKEMARGMDVADGGGLILRTNALGQTKTTLNRDLNALQRLWKRISQEARRAKGKTLLYSDQDIVLQALRDYLDNTVEEVLVDQEGAYKKAQDYIQAFMPRSRTKLTHYTDKVPLFSRYDLETQIERIYQRSAPLPSGGSIVIDHTEALTAIDVNSGRSTKAASQEETALHTNMEAAEEVARQLRLRDIGGLLVVDFIDMRSRRNQKKVEKALADALKADKARTQICRTSPNGLIEINRQRLHQAIQLRTQRVCLTCGGTGRVPSPEILSLHLLREIQARVQDGSIERIRIMLNPEIANAFQNQRRRDLAAIETENDVRIEVISSPKLQLGEREIDWYARAALRRSPIVKKATTAAVDLAEEVAKEEPAGRRKRPPRRRRSKSSGEEGTPEETGEERLALDDEDADTDVDIDSDTDSEDKPKRSRSRSRRRRRSGRSRSQSDENGDADTATAKEPVKGENVDADRGSSDSSPEEAVRADGTDGDTDSEGASRPRRRRSRRRRRGGRGQGGSAEASTEREAASDGNTGQDSGPPRNANSETARSAEASRSASPPPPPAEPRRALPPMTTPIDSTD